MKEWKEILKCIYEKSDKEIDKIDYRNVEKKYFGQNLNKDQKIKSNSLFFDLKDLGYIENASEFQALGNADIKLTSEGLLYCKNNFDKNNDDENIEPYKIAP